MTTPATVAAKLATFATEISATYNPPKHFVCLTNLFNHVKQLGSIPPESSLADFLTQDSLASLLCALLQQGDYRIACARADSPRVTKAAIVLDESGKVYAAPEIATAFWMWVDPHSYLEAIRDHMERMASYIKSYPNHF
jgi:hypothetical protein